MDTKEEMKEKLDAELKGIREDLGKFTEDARKEIKTLGKESEETKGRIDQALAKTGEIQERLQAIETKMSKSTAEAEAVSVKSVGEIVTEHAGYQEFKSKMLKRSEKIEVGSFHKTAIINATGQNQPLVPAQRVPGILGPLGQRLSIRDILSVVPTTSNLIEFVRESSSTNAAAPQGKGTSPFVQEGIAKAESALAFQLAYEPVTTVAHWIPASRQVLDDSAALQAYINGRMTYFLKLVEEQQLLNGTGTAGELNGLITQSTDYDTALDVTGDTAIDTLRHAMLQCELANGNVTAFVLNPTDWHNIELVKTAGTVSSGMYVFSNPHQAGIPSIWGRPVVISQSMSSGEFLTGDFALAADLWDRMQSTVEISREHADFFTRNMVAILCEERLALVVYRPEVLFNGTFPSASPKA